MRATMFAAAVAAETTLSMPLTIIFLHEHIEVDGFRCCIHKELQVRQQKQPTITVVVLFRYSLDFEVLHVVFVKHHVLSLMLLRPMSWDAVRSASLIFLALPFMSQVSADGSHNGTCFMTACNMKLGLS